MDKNITCFVSKRPISIEQAYKADLLRENLFSMIKADFPGFTKDDYVSIESLNLYRKKYLESLVAQETGDVDKLQSEVLDAISNKELLSKNIEEDIIEELTLGQRMADKIAEFGGSWTFISLFFSFIVIWIGINVWLIASRPFDPYPFILLNLLLSCLAAIQAPIIMMSQNRKEQKDRKRSENDYKINLKAELEIKLLHEKVDHLISHQNKRLLEIQEVQADFLEDILNEIKKDKGVHEK